MPATALQDIVAAVVRRAERQGYVLPEDVRAELARAGAPESLWKDILALARPSLCYRDGRYCIARPASPRAQEEQEQLRRVREAVGRIVSRRHPLPPEAERREHPRTDFVQPVLVCTEDGGEFTLLSRDLSPTGIRLIGTCRLLGQKVRVHVPSPGDSRPVEFLVCVLWTCALGDDLVENGGRFLDVAAEP